MKKELCKHTVAQAQNSGVSKQVFLEENDNISHLEDSEMLQCEHQSLM